MRRRTLHPPHRFGHVNITPMIDVLMCLIVFYLIVGKLASDRLPAMDLPRAAGRDQDTPGAEIMLSVREVGGSVEIQVDGEVTTVSDVESVVARRLAAESDARVLLRADRDLAYGNVSPLVAACRRAGAESIRMAVENAR